MCFTRSYSFSSVTSLFWWRAWKRALSSYPWFISCVRYLKGRNNLIWILLLSCLWMCLFLYFFLEFIFDVRFLNSSRRWYTRSSMGPTLWFLNMAYWWLLALIIDHNHFWHSFIIISRSAPYATFWWILIHEIVIFSLFQSWRPSSQQQILLNLY